MKRRDVFNCTRKRNPAIYDNIMYGISFHVDTPFRAAKYWVEHPDNKGLFNNSKYGVNYDMNDITDYAVNLDWLIFANAQNDIRKRNKRVFQKDFQ